MPQDTENRPFGPEGKPDPTAHYSKPDNLPVKDVRIVLEEEQTRGYPPDPPHPAIPGSVYLRPVIQVELQP